MKTYLEFSNKGDITEHQFNNRKFNKENYTDFKYIEKIMYNKYNFILLYNTFDDSNSVKNITHLPFYDKDIYGNFLLFSYSLNELKSENKIENKSEKINENPELNSCNYDTIQLKSLTEIKFLKLINIVDKPIEDYSSDDFNLSD